MLEDLRQKIREKIKSKVIVTTTLRDKGIAVLFDYIDDETLTTEAAITDNYISQNYAIQDHIAIKPKIYRLRGCVGEVVYRNPVDLTNWVKNLVDNNPILKKTVEYSKPIVAVSGIISNYTQAAINIAKQLESSFDRYKQMFYDFVDPNPYTNKRQQEVVSMFNYALQNRIPVTLNNLKFNYFSEGLEEGYESEYYIQSVSAHQGDNAFISDIEITIKQVRKATTKISQLDKNKFDFGVYTNVDVQKTVEVNQGKVSGTTVAEQGWQKATEIKAAENTSLVEIQNGKVTFNLNWVKKLNNQIKGAWQNRNMYNTTQFGGTK